MAHHADIFGVNMAREETADVLDDTIHFQLRPTFFRRLIQGFHFMDHRGHIVRALLEKLRHHGRHLSGPVLRGCEGGSVGRPLRFAAEFLIVQELKELREDRRLCHHLLIGSLHLSRRCLLGKG